MRDHEGDDLQGPEADARHERRRHHRRVRRARRRVRLAQPRSRRVESGIDVNSADPIAVAARGLELTGMEYIHAIFGGELPAPPISQLIGFRGVEAEPGRAVFEMHPGPEHYNPIGSVHGGYAATLLDSVMGLAIHTMLPAGTGYTTLEFKVSFIKGMTEDTGAVRSEGRTLNVGRRSATAEGRITDAKGRLLAHATTTCLIFELPKEAAKGT